MSQHRATVVVADDHPLFRDGLTRAVRQRPDLELVGEAQDGRAALNLIREIRPDVALLDVRMPELDGLQVLRALQRDEVATTVVFLSADTNADLVYQGIVSGASAFLRKDSDRQEICDVISASARGEVRLPSDIQKQLVQQIQLHGRSQRPLLTSREREVLGLIAEGLSAPEIAVELTLSAATIKSHLQTLYEKLGVNDRAAAVATAMRGGLLE